MGHVGKTVTQNIVSTSEITDGTITNDDLATDIAITTTGDTSLKGNVTINEDSADKDFRVESNDHANMLFVDGGNNKVGVGTASPDGALHIKGVSDHGRIVLESGGTSGSDNNMFMQFHNGGGTEIAQIAIEEGASNEGQLIFKTGGTTTAMTIDKDGHITKPKQPAFLAHPASDSGDIATGSYYTVTFGTEVFDVGADFASNTFTAPVTGKYQLNAEVFLYQVDKDAQYYMLQIVTSNRTYQSIIEPDTGQDSVYWTMSIAQICDMDASDTAYVRVYQPDGAQQTNVIHDSNNTFFGGFLAC